MFSYVENKAIFVSNLLPRENSGQLLLLIWSLFNLLNDDRLLPNYACPCTTVRKDEPIFDQKTLNYSVRGSITVRKTLCDNCLDSAALFTLN